MDNLSFLKFNFVDALDIILVGLLLFYFYKLVKGRCFQILVKAKQGIISILKTPLWLVIPPWFNLGAFGFLNVIVAYSKGCPVSISITLPVINIFLTPDGKFLWALVFKTKKKKTIKKSIFFR